MTYIDNEALNSIYKTSDLISNIMIIIITIFLALLFQKDYAEDREYYQQLSLLGYNQKEIRRVYLASLITKISLYLIISIIMILIALGVLKVIVYYWPFIFRKKQLQYNFKSFLLIILIYALNLVINLILHYHVGKDS